MLCVAPRARACADAVLWPQDVRGSYMVGKKLKTALRGVSTVFRAGQIAAIMGPSGARARPHSAAGGRSLAWSQARARRRY